MLKVWLGMASENIIDADLKPVKQETEEDFIQTQITSEFILKDEPNSVVQIEIMQAEEILSCQIFDKNFQNKKALRNHKIVQSDIGPFKCPICSKQVRISVIFHLRKF